MSLHKIHSLNDEFDLLQHQALKDNYNYILIHRESRKSLLVDPSEASTSLRIILEFQLKVDTLLITHHHPDHIGGVDLILKKFPVPVYGYSGDRHRLPPMTNELNDGDEFFWQKQKIKAMHAPGHTTGHFVYHLPELAILFVGDVLFTLGCGRLFEGTYEDLLQTMEKLRHLPPETRLLCAHEYTANNIPFARTVDGANFDLQARLLEDQVKLSRQEFTVPSLLATELQTNPFLRFDDPSLKLQNGLSSANDLEVLTFLRKTRDSF